jgi:large subunit ribosomal protein L25
MEEFVIQAKRRQVVGKQVKVLRREGWLPAVIYGQGVDTIPISLEYLSAVRVLSTVSLSRLVVVDIEGERHNALVRERQRHPVTGNILHVDFHEVSMTETLRTMVSLELQGDSSAVEELGGILVVGQEQVEVECLPGDLPSQIGVDISVLKEIGDGLYVRDLPVPSKVDILTDPDEMVALVTHPAAEPEEEEEEELELEMEEPEVIERGRREEEEEEAGEEE